MLKKIKLWLDDVRPAPPGWFHVRTVFDAKMWLADTDIVVTDASLDHDLGACPACLADYDVKDAEEWLIKSKGMVAPNCPHVGTGLDLVQWMVETGNWPTTIPQVHSANPYGRTAMQQVIKKWWSKRVT